MKKIFFTLGIFAILFTLTSCQKDQKFIRASITRYHGAEKVHLDGSNFACWDGDESIWINGGSSEYPITLIPNDDDHFMIDMGTTLDQGTTLNAVFHPDSISLGDYNSADNTIVVNLPAVQTYSEVNGNQVINAPMVAKATVNRQGGAELVFSNACALLKVQLRPKVICYYIEVTSNNAPLAGAGTLDIDDASLTMTGTTRTVRLNVNSESNPQYCRADGIYYIVLPPYMGSNLTVTVYDNPKTLMTFSQTDPNGHNLGASEIGIVDVATYDHGRGIFSVSATEKVSFAPGNLTGSSGSYSFTTSQSDRGTVYDYAESDISAYSNAMGSNWTLLTAAQWGYLLNRVDANGNVLQSRCTLNRQHGLILYPDDWSSANGYPARIIDGSPSRWQDISSTWATLESYGAVFLPGYQSNDNAHEYWTSTPNTAVVFGNGNGLPNGGLGVVGSTVRTTIPNVQFSNGLSIEDGCVRLAHFVQ